MKKTLALASLLAACAPALAITTTDTALGALTSGVATGGVVTKAVGEFMDLFTFSVAAPSAVAATVTSVPLDLPFTVGLDYGIAFFSPELGFGGIALFTEAMDPIAVDTDATDGYAISVPLLAAGTYKYAVIGTAIGLSGGVYASYVQSLAAVPEPETYAMLLAGLATIGFVARRRRQD